MSRNGKRIMNNGGYSMTELLVVLCVVGVLLGIASVFGYGSLVRSQVEKQTREMFADLMNARVSALQRNRVFFVTLAANQYAIYEDTNPSPDGDGNLQTTLDTRMLQKATAYALNTSGTISFSSCGLASETNYTIRVVSTAAPSFDCILLTPTRLLMGKWDGTCVIQ
jgi:prepilin-type N-terminal cleavage/methylation domain-containing protein